MAIFTNIAIKKPRIKAISKDKNKERGKPEASKEKTMRERGPKPTNTNIVIGQTTYIHLTINLRECKLNCVKLQ